MIYIFEFCQGKHYLLVVWSLFWVSKIFWLGVKNGWYSVTAHSLGSISSASWDKQGGAFVVPRIFVRFYNFKRGRHSPGGFSLNYLIGKLCGI
jgi:hypothetical protein